MPDVYRAYGAGNVLLYVGMSINGRTRLQAHRLKSKWYADMVGFAVTPYDCYLKAQYAEGIAINDELPLHNVHIPKFATGPQAPVHVSQRKKDDFFDRHYRWAGGKRMLAAAARHFGFVVTNAHLERMYGPRRWYA